MMVRAQGAVLMIDDCNAHKKEKFSSESARKLPLYGFVILDSDDENSDALDASDSWCLL